jgi:crotonobetainyl-CoA:carnitine CoA-transferase CaiB-like acyl-CoA transferase
MAPELSAHTDEVLNSLGYDADAIADLRARNIV